MNNSESLIFSARAAQDSLSTVNTDETQLLLPIVDFIIQAISNGNSFTDPISILNIPSATVQNVIKQLKFSGYTVTITGTIFFPNSEIIVSW